MVFIDSAILFGFSAFETFFGARPKMLNEAISVLAILLGVIGAQIGWWGGGGQVSKRRIDTRFCPGCEGC